MDLTAEKFPHFDEAGKALVRKAYEIAAEVLKDDTRDNGAPFIEHPLGVALIASDEIGLPAVCVAAVFLHEATRKHPETDISQAGFPEEVLKIVEGLNK
ncbi:MAG: HD domain-containing protein, partial [Bacteroidales bacterium]|nr:HD domain-containing protein [Bacteroidales bacterium]